MNREHWPKFLALLDTLEEAGDNCPECMERLRSAAPPPYDCGNGHVNPQDLDAALTAFTWSRGYTADAGDNVALALRSVGYKPREEVRCDAAVSLDYIRRQFPRSARFTSHINTKETEIKGYWSIAVEEERTDGSDEQGARYDRDREEGILYGEAVARILGWSYTARRLRSARALIYAFPRYSDLGWLVESLRMSLYACPWRSADVDYMETLGGVPMVRPNQGERTALLLHMKLAEWYRTHPRKPENV